MGAAGLAMVAASLITPAYAQAAPAGVVDAGVPFSSAVYGTGCLYNLTVPVNSSGRVTFWERRPGFPEHYIGAAPADGAIATVQWVPRYLGDRLLYAKQNGVTGKATMLRVHQGYGAGWTCFAL